MIISAVMNNKTMKDFTVIYFFTETHFKKKKFCSTEKPADLTVIMISAAVAVVVLSLVLIAVIGFIIYKKENGERTKDFHI